MPDVSKFLVARHAKSFVVEVYINDVIQLLSTAVPNFNCLEPIFY
jgi:hypothetical protein